MKIAILGAGESGVGAALLAKKIGAEVWLSDKGEIAEKYKQVLAENKIPFESGQHTKEKFFEAEMIVKSPGIPDRVALIQELKVKGKSIVSEIEFAARYTNDWIIAVTGSNGKTTTASLIFHLLKQAGKNVALGGNIGKSFAALIATESHEGYVLEVSSFQLDDIQQFRPKVSVLLNITPDHLDRYEYRLDLYADAKMRIAENQEATDTFIYGANDPVTRETMTRHSIAANPKGFALEQNSETVAWMEESEMVMKEGIRFDLAGIKLLGKHNQMNTMAAIMAVREMGLGEKEIIEGLYSFHPIEHRLEWVAEIEEVVYINDSKATNIDAVKYALDSMNRPTIWLAGGVDKGNDYQELESLVKNRVKAIIVLGEEIEKFSQHFDKDIHQVMSMSEAIEKAVELAKKGDAVLLSPACASFDLFQNYEDRGRQFKSAVNKLIDINS